MPLLRILLLVFTMLSLIVVEPSAAEEEPRGVLSLKDALAITLLRNPELEEFSWEVRASEARLLQAGLRPNPEVSLDVEDVLGSGEFNGGLEAQVTLQLSQLIELGGKRSARINVASRTRDRSSRDFEAKRVEILADVTRRFIRLLARQNEVALARANVELGETTLRAVRRRVAAGADSPLEQKKTVTALARSRIAGEHAQHELQVARYDLAVMWGSSAPQFDGAEGNLFGTRTVPPYHQLLARISASPEIVRGLSEMQLREAEIRLADSKRVPNVSLSGGPRWHEGPDDNAFVFGLSVPLPLADRNQGGSQEARALLRKSEQSIKATEARLRALLFALHQELLRATNALDALDREILPGAEESLALSRSGFAEGRFSYLELADAQRTLGEVKRERIETATSYHEFILEIERLLGGPIEGELPPATDKEVGP